MRERSDTTSPQVRDLEMSADEVIADPALAAERYEELGCLVVRGLLADHVDGVRADIERAADNARSMYDQAVACDEGWLTPDGTLWIPAPEGYGRDRQIMVLNVSYRTSAAFFLSALHEPTLDLMEHILGPDVELMNNGQCLYKEPVGGHAKKLHQDAAYFEHRYQGPVAAFVYAVDTDLQNGALHVIPGSHRLGLLAHTDTSSHLGLDEQTWSWDDAVAVEGNAGDAILFSVNTVHGSRENRSSASRPGFIHRYRRADDYVVVDAATVAKRQEAERRAAEASKQDQYGLMVRGYRR